MKALLLPNLTKQDALLHTGRVAHRLAELGVSCVMPEQYCSVCGAFPVRFCRSSEEGLTDCDIVIAVGGDGTIIHSAKEAAAFGKPVLGVNVGRLGFVAGLETDELDRLERLIAGDYIVDERMMLEVTLYREGQELSYYALNDAVLARGALSKILDFRVLLNESNVGDYRADGLIVSTPTGSTAYSLSAGGPVIDPALRCLLLSPICPHSLFTRPVVFGENSLLQIQAGSSEQGVNCYLTVDGQISVPLENNEAVRCRAAKRKARLLKLKDTNFYDVVNYKLAERRS